MNETVKVNSEPEGFPSQKLPLFPTNIVPLPSKGLLYSEDHPLSKGVIEMKFMTTKEENILTTESYITQGVVIDKFLQSMIISPKFNYDTLLIGDKNALIIASRIYGYGENYKVEVTSPSGRKQQMDIDLTLIENKEVDETLFNNENRFTYEFENRIGKYVIEFKLPTVLDERQIDEKLKKFKKAGAADTQVTTRLQQLIISVNGNTDQNYIKLFIENEFLALDSRRFREYIAKIQPGPDLDIEIIDEGTGEPFRTTVSIGPTFFWPDSGV